MRSPLDLFFSSFSPEQGTVARRKVSRSWCEQSVLTFFFVSQFPLSFSDVTDQSNFPAVEDFSYLDAPLHHIPSKVWPTGPFLVAVSVFN